MFILILVIISGIVTIKLRTSGHIMIYLFMNIINIFRIIIYQLEFNINYIIFLNLAILLIFFLISVMLCCERKRGKSYNHFHKKIEDLEIKNIISLTIESEIPDPVILLKMMPWTYIPSCLISLIMIEGVRSESNRRMFYYYIVSLALSSFHLYVFVVFINMIKSSPTTTISIVQVIIEFIIPFLITVITIINSIICHKNFGKGLKVYLNYEPKTFKEIIKYNDDLDQCYKDDD
ncbi:hypothetical protein GLOIN_2v1776151 [Rhizophagus clarus]|uniref:Uncharacterized protein n=1 Tax=Rhizophagus clarus TaxID=94130 RepID=A0A8H3KVZ3_9GLOM|nr:hypothetical protein GLOIN_2v1776151 [Rhizophagus clarus]